MTNPQPPRSPNVLWHHATVARADRERMNGHKSVMLWFTGLSGSGKSTVAHAVEDELFKMSCRTYVLDGDNVRHGLNGNLGFSVEDRAENLRRVGEVGKLFVEAGVIAMAAFISPFRSERRRVRGLYPHGDFLEIYVSCPVEVCEERDVKGLYKKARAGEIKEFTGISAPYEAPGKAELTVKSHELSLEQSVAAILSYLQSTGIVPRA